VRVPGGVPAPPTAPEEGGLAGVVRRAAYAFPEHRARRWMLLLAADRLQRLGWRLGRTGGAVSAVLVVALLGALIGAAATRRGR
jgi:hypothetical protein